MKKGFTLIELLVVVLIIGILAAIALPQYTKAVERSRMAEAVQVLGDLATAQSIYYMTNNSFASEADIKKGDITFADLPTANFTWTFDPAAPTGANKSIIMKAKRSGGMNKDGEIGIKVSSTGAITKACLATGTSATL